jgi:transposase
VGNAVVFTEVPPPVNVAMTPAVLEIVLDSGPIVRVPAGADAATLQAGAPGPPDNMLTLPASVRIFVAHGATDLRRSFDRLSAQVQEVLRRDPLSGHVFVFFNRQRNRVKLLLWERDGFWLQYMRLGAFAVLDGDEINARELYLLLEGIEVRTSVDAILAYPSIADDSQCNVAIPPGRFHLSSVHYL